MTRCSEVTITEASEDDDFDYEEVICSFWVFCKFIMVVLKKYLFIYSLRIARFSTDFS